MTLHAASVGAARVEETQDYYFVFDQIRIEADLTTFLIAQFNIGNTYLANTADIELDRLCGRYSILPTSHTTRQNDNQQRRKEATFRTHRSHLNLTSTKTLFVLGIVGKKPANVDENEPHATIGPLVTGLTSPFNVFAETLWTL